MDNQLYGLPTQQACESAPKIQEMQEIKEQNEHKECALRFRMLSVGCFFYALFYTFCLYHNKSGITYPFFIGGTLYFFCFYLKKFGATAARDRRFLMGSMILLGIINCTTDSWVLISLNRLFITVLIGVWLLESFHESFAWRLGAWGRALMHLVFGSFTQIYKPVMDAYWSNKQRERKRERSPEQEVRKERIWYGILGIGISIPVLFFILLLLGSADALFNEMLCKAWDSLFSWSLPEFLTNGEWFQLLWMIGWSFLLVYGLLTYIGKREYIEAAVRTKTIECDAFIAIAFLSLITVVYCLFCGIQIFGLFLGWMTLPEGYTYAGYARQGFFQLMFVTFINFAIIIVTSINQKEKSEKQIKYQKIMNLLLIIFTIIIIISAFFRMNLYEQKYGYTYLRLFVYYILWSEIIYMIPLTLYILGKKIDLLKSGIMIITAMYLIVNFSNIDYTIAKKNIDRYFENQSKNEIDFNYLESYTGLDAISQIKRLLNSEDKALAEKARYYLYEEKENLQNENESWQEFNLSRWNARNELIYVDLHEGGK